MKYIEIIFKVSVPPSQETHSVSIIMTIVSMLFRETVTVYCENDMKHINTMCGQNAEF
jgi:translation initiation factor IF-1